MGEVPQLVMIAGPNGSGKSTLIAALRAQPQFQLPALYINADDLQRERGLPDRESQLLATELRAQAIDRRRDVMFETVMSHPSKIAELQRAKNAGYQLTVHFVATDNPDINVQRVITRVSAGGHNVPVERIRARYLRTLALAPVALAYADQAVLFDNTQSGDTGFGLAVQAVLQADHMNYVQDEPASWVQTVVMQVNQRAAEIAAMNQSATTKGLALQLAGLEQGSTQGSVMVVGQYYLLQHNDTSQTLVLHDRSLLGDLAQDLAPGTVCRMDYREGVVELFKPDLPKLRRHLRRKI
jgi:predicted ABC-type ATPase